MSFASRWAAAAAIVGCVIVACSSDPAAGDSKSYCGVTRAAGTKCTEPTSCDTTLTSQCSAFDKAVSPTARTAAKDCLESGVCGASLCLTRALKLAKPTAAHDDLAKEFCANCAPDVPGCLTKFYAAKSDLPGALVLPYSEAIARAVTSACAMDPGACRANFATCASATVATTLNGLVSGDLASCITGAFTSDEPTTPGGSTSSGGPQIATCTSENCQGCCRDDKCRDGSEPEACGRAGNSCQTCSTVQSCTEQGQCREPCGPNNCKGCCDESGACVPGESPEKCGGDGAACTKCNAVNPDLVCNDNKCVDGSCKASCAGCCTAAGCQIGNATNACGGGGKACDVCGYGKACSSLACALDTGSVWDVVIVSVEAPERKLNGDFWDPFSGNPDPFVKVASNLGTAPSNTGQTTIAADNFRPAFGETVMRRISARELINNFTFEVWDDDFDFDDQIGGCKVTVTANSFGGALQEMRCTQTPSLPSVTLRYKFVRPQ